MKQNDVRDQTIDQPDPDSLTITTVGVAGTIITIIVVLLVQGLYESRNRREFEKKVVAAVPGELRDLRAAQLAKLSATGWVDKKNGVVAIPIEKAMELLAADPNPAAPAGLAGAK